MRGVNPSSRSWLEVFEPAARAAVEAAIAEARSAGSARIGTEHLLLGLLVAGAAAPNGAAEALATEGVTLTAARHKLREATGAAGEAYTGPLEWTARGQRALTRAQRFSHVRRAPAIGPEDLLLGVLDVEGTAGQVLRGLGADVERLRSRTAPRAGEPPQPGTPHADGEPPQPGAPHADGEPPQPGAPHGDGAEAAVDVAAPAGVRPECPYCGTELAGGLTYRLVTAHGPTGPRATAVYACGACGQVLGVGPA